MFHDEYLVIEACVQEEDNMSLDMLCENAESIIPCFTPKQHG